MSYHDPRNRISKTEKVDFIVPERLLSARIARGISQKEAAELLDIPQREVGLMENGHVKDIPKEILFKYMKAFNFPKNFFYQVRWERV
jgi:transcriptional regulator with XRE-family HTH domain